MKYFSRSGLELDAPRVLVSIFFAVAIRLLCVGGGNQALRFKLHLKSLQTRSVSLPRQRIVQTATSVHSPDLAAASVIGVR